MLLILHGMALRVNLIKNNVGLWTKINVGRVQAAVIQSREIYTKDGKTIEKIMKQVLKQI